MICQLIELEEMDKLQSSKSEAENLNSNKNK